MIILLMIINKIFHPDSAILFMKMVYAEKEKAVSE